MKGQVTPRAALAKQRHSERSSVKLWLKGRLGTTCRVGLKSQNLEDFALFLPFVRNILIFLIDSSCIWYGCLAPKPFCLDNCRRSRDTQPSIKSDRASSHSSCIVYEMSHFHGKCHSRLVLDVMGTSHFILLILTLRMLAQLLSSSLILLRWNWETQSKVTFCKWNHWIWFPRFGVVQQACVFSFLSSAQWGRKNWVGQSGDCHMCSFRKGSHYSIILFNGHMKNV